VFIKSSELNEYTKQGAVIISQYACPGCNGNFHDLDGLKIHVDTEHCGEYNCAGDRPPYTKTVLTL
jgi:hypothetical protein